MKIIKKNNPYIVVSINYKEMLDSKNIINDVYDFVGEDYVIISMYDDPMISCRNITMRLTNKSILHRKFGIDHREILFRKFEGIC